MNEKILNIVNDLIKYDFSISFAESATGGALASTLTKVAGVSKIFKGSFVTYSDEYKIKFLGVKKKTIDEYGVVSKEVASEMADGLEKITNANIIVSVTGNAGPSKGDINEPVGRVYVGIWFGDTETFELNLSGSREEVINGTVDFVFDEIGKIINDYKKYQLQDEK